MNLSNLFNIFSWNKDDSDQEYTYKYQRHPFESPTQFFSIKADSQEEANEKAKKHFAKEIFGKRLTCLLDFFPIEKKK
jgi:hypothetical protein